MAIQRSYPRLLDNSLPSIQRAFNQAFDYIFQLQSGGSSSSSNSSGGGSSAGSQFYAFANSALVLTSSYQDVPDCTLSPPPGAYVIIGVFEFTTNSVAGAAQGALIVDGTMFPNTFALALTTGLGGDITVTAAQSWVIPSLAGTVKLQAKVATAGIGGNVGAGSTTITAIKIG